MRLSRKLVVGAGGLKTLFANAILLNTPLAIAYVAGSYRVPSDPDSDHKRISAHPQPRGSLPR